MTRSRAAGLVIPALAALLAAALSCPLQADDDTHTVTINVTSDLDNKSLEGARVLVTGPKVLALEYPDDYIHRLEIRGVKTDRTGRVVVKLGPGTYTLGVKHKTHHTVQGWTFTVPDPRDPGRRVHELRPKLHMSERIREGMKRTVTVTVRGRRTGPDGQATVEPLEGARVQVWTEGSGLMQRRSTDGDGEVTFESAHWFIGDILKVEASLKGFKTRGTQLAIGAMPTAGTSPWDEVPITLDEAHEEGAWVDIQVRDAKTEKPVADASATLEHMGKDGVSLGKTDADGKLERVVLPLGPDGAAEGWYRLKVAHKDYEEKWEELSGEYLQPSTEARGYTVFLSERGPELPPDMTECERGAFERFARFARGKDPDLAIRDGATDISVQWEERPAAGGKPAVKGSAHFNFHPDKEDFDFQWGFASTYAGRKPTVVAGHEAAVGPLGRQFFWKSGRFIGGSWLHSDLRDYPTPEEARALAEQVAGILGDCPGFGEGDR